jgi:HlyD family secretion protein
MKRWLLGIFVVVVALGAAGWVWRPIGGKADGPTWRTATVERGELVATVSASGTLNAVVLVEVGSQVSGQVRDLFADFNQLVRRGEVIARIDPETFEAKVSQAQAELEVAQAAVAVQRAQILQKRAEAENAKAAIATAKAQLAKVRIAVEDARRDLERKEPLAQRGVVSSADIERARYALRSAEAEALAARSQEDEKVSMMHSAGAGAAMAEAQLGNTEAQVRQKTAALRQAQVDLERTYIRAPVDGVVVNRSVNRGQTVAASLQAPTLFTIAQDLRQMQVEASVVEADVGRVAAGQRATFTVDAYPGRSFSGEVVQIRKAPVNTSNVVTYTVVISAENEDQALLPGMTANLRLLVARKEDVLKVPNAALRFRLPDAPAIPDEARRRGAAKMQPGLPGRVFVLDGEGSPRPVSVRVGISDGQMTEILSGDVAEDAKVVIGGGASPPRPSPRTRLF